METERSEAQHSDEHPDDWAEAPEVAALEGDELPEGDDPVDLDGVDLGADEPAVLDEED